MLMSLMSLMSLMTMTLIRMMRVMTKMIMIMMKTRMKMMMMMLTVLVMIVVMSTVAVAWAGRTGRFYAAISYTQNKNVPKLAPRQAGDCLGAEPRDLLPHCSPDRFLESASNLAPVVSLLPQPEQASDANPFGL